jgi:hypothetical protein
MFNKLILFSFVFILIAFVGLAIAQETGTLPPDFDWSQFGVSTGVIVAIITVVQFIKQWLPEKLVVFAPIILASIAFFVVGGGDQPIEHVFYWAAAAAYLWKMANVVTPENVLKSKQ